MKSGLGVLAVLPLIYGSVFLVGCSTDDDYDDFDHYDYSYKYPAKNYNEAIQIRDDLTIKCAEPNNCPESVGSLVSIRTKASWRGTEINVGMCSQGLIDTNKVLTNRHCVPDGLQRVGANCSDIKVLFPATATKPAEKVECLKVLALSKRNATVGGPDWAVLQITPTKSSRTPGVPSAEGIPHKSKVSVYPTYFDKKNAVIESTVELSGTIRPVTCTTAMNSFFTMAYSHPESEIFTGFCDNKIVSGNSGSVVLDESQKTIGVISIGRKPDEETITALGRQIPVDQSITIGTRIGCIKYLASSPSSICDQEYSSDEQKMLAVISSVLTGLFVPETTKTAVENMRTNQHHIRWTEPILDRPYTPWNANYEFPDTDADDFDPRIIDYAYQVSSSAERNQYIKCIESEFALEKLGTIQYPHLESDFADVKITPGNILFSTELKLKPVLIDARYRKNSHDFLLTVKGFETNGLQEEVESLAAKSILSFFGCLYGISDWGGCSDFFSIDSQLSNLYFRNGIGETQQKNQSFINQQGFEGVSTASRSVPVCQ